MQPTVSESKISFNGVFASVVTLTVLSAVVALWCSLFIAGVKEADIDSKRFEAIKEMFTTFSTCWKMGFGGILGLIGGKKTSQ